MKWAKLDAVASENYLLYLVLMWVVAPYSNRPVDHFLKRVLGYERGFGCDPGWEIEWLSDLPDGDYFRVWADKDISCLDHEESIYDGKTFYTATRETLSAYAVAHPHRAVEIAGLIRLYGFDLI